MPSPMAVPDKLVTVLRVAHDHPSLAGHFPGEPVVPGVLLLDQVIAAAEAWLGYELNVRSLPQVKFIAPLLPEQDAQLELSCAEAKPDDALRELRFVVRREAVVIAQGMMQVRALQDSRGRA